MKVGEVDSSEDDLNPSECLMLNYQPREGVPGFEVETRDELFWASVVLSPDPTPSQGKGSGTL